MDLTSDGRSRGDQVADRVYNENLGIEFLDHLVDGDKMHLKAVKRRPG
jgi:hypothetical protein